MHTLAILNKGTIQNVNVNTFKAVLHNCSNERRALTQNNMCCHLQTKQEAGVLLCDTSGDIRAALLSAPKPQPSACENVNGKKSLPSFFFFLFAARLVASLFPWCASRSQSHPFFTLLSVCQETLLLSFRI